ncbi:MAG: hypothetical protein FWE05_05975 [Defluviitaleaceae bacterium]|nr:hypothetical protein [Defluviitaleaceae bacterium]
MANKKNKVTAKRGMTYHNTRLLLKIFRNCNMNLYESMEVHREDFKKEFDIDDISEYLDALGEAGLDFKGAAKLEGHARAMLRTKEMLNLIRVAAEVVRNTNAKGELYYSILYHAYLSHEQPPKSLHENIERVQGDGHYKINGLNYKGIYYADRKKAIELIGDALWGYTSRKAINILNNFLPEK